MNTLSELRAQILRRWPEWLLSGLVVLVFAPVLASAETFYLRDIHSYVAPLKTLWRLRLLNGELPQWIPNIGLGVPMLADPSNQTLYPLAVVLLLPEPLGLELFIVMHILIAGLGALQLGRHLGADDAGAFVSGLTFALGGYLVTVATTNCLYVCSAAFIPWVVLAMAKLHSGESVSRGVIRLSGLLALQLLGGDFQAVIFATATGFVMALLISSRDQSLKPIKNLWRSLGFFSSSAALGALLAAPQLLPALLFAPHSLRRKALSLEDAQIFSTHPWRLLDLFASHPWGVPFGTYFGGGFEIGEKSIPWALSLYVGAASLALVPLALSVGPREARHRALKLLVLVALGLALTLGAHTPIYGWFHQYVPLFGRFRFPEKTFVLTAMLFSLLNGLGVTAAARRGMNSRLGALLPVIVLGAAVAAASAMHFWGGAFGQSINALRSLDDASLAVSHAKGRLLVAALVGIVVLWAWLQNRTKLLLGICVLDLVASGAEVPLSGDVSQSRLAPEIARLVHLGERNGEPTRFYDRRAVYDGTGGPVVEQASSWTAFRNRHLSSGISYLNAHSSSLPYSGFVLTWGLNERPQRMARVGSATSVIVADDVRGPFGGAPEQFRVGPFVWLENQQSLPRAYLLTSAFSAGGSEQEAEALLFDERFPIERVALLIEPVPTAISPFRLGSTPDMAQPCDLELYEPERVRFVCDAKHAAVAVLADQFLTGWTLTVDGEPRESLRVQFALRGAVVPPGRHVLEYRYRTPGFAAGIALAAFGVLVLLLLWHARRREWIA